MQVKILEIRDSGTMIPVMCINMNPGELEDIKPTADTVPGRIRERVDGLAARLWHMRRVGFPCDGRPNIAMTDLNCDGGACWNDPYGWKGGTRTHPVAHNYIIDHWDELKDGDVVCVEHISGERPEPKVSERFSEPDPIF